MSLMDRVAVMSRSAVNVRWTMLVMGRRVKLMRRPALSAWRTPAAMSAWKHDSTGRSTSWPAQDSELWHGLPPYENRPPRQEVGDGPRLRQPQRLFLRVRVCIAMLWCARRDSNPHARRHQNLNLARLPIPPLALCGSPYRFWNLRCFRRARRGRARCQSMPSSLRRRATWPVALTL